MVSKQSAQLVSFSLSRGTSLVPVISWLDATANVYDAALTKIGELLENSGY